MQNNWKLSYYSIWTNDVAEGLLLMRLQHNKVRNSKTSIRQWLHLHGLVDGELIFFAQKQIDSEM